MTSVTQWSIIDGTCMGASHERRGTPNQDALATRMMADGRVAIAAVSDGHGGERYVRSELGARLAVEIACDALESWWMDARGDQTPVRLERQLRDEVAPTITRLWRDRVLAHAREHAFTAEESERAGVELDRQPLVAYGATLLLACSSEDAIAMAQLGDGDIVVVRRGAVELPIEPDERLVASQTTSLCLDAAERDFRVAVISDLDDVELVLLSTDGYGNSFADDSWERSVGRDIAQRLAEHGVEAVRVELPKWLGASAQASGDDTSVVLLVPAERAPAGEASAGREAPAAGHRLVRFAVAGLVLGLVIGWILGNATAGPATKARAGTTLNVDQTVTTVGADGGGPRRSRSSIVTPSGRIVTFVADPQRSAPHLEQSVSDAGATTRLVLGSATWEATADGHLIVTGPDGAPAVVLPVAMSVAAIAAAGNAIWAIDRAEVALVAVDATTHRVFPAIDIGGRSATPNSAQPNTPPTSPSGG